TIGGSQTLSAEDHWSRGELVRGKRRRGHALHVGGPDTEIGFARGLDARCECAGAKAARAGNGAVSDGLERSDSRSQGHGSIGTNSSPSCSGQPSMRFMFWTAWPAAPLPRLSRAPRAMTVSVSGSAAY